ncbi:metal ABC transporter ATP-binding protein [Candidatus Micrarchaeota archaeon]|nr:metal ABC transporter ATP-binding protein [Candidatus Micrarchaeota archaeon]
MDVIEIKDLSFSYNENEVLNNISVEIGKGEFVAMIGPNGSGKTTLIKIILGLLNPTGGSIKLFGKDISEFRDWNEIGYIPQKGSIEENFPGSISEVISLKEGSCSEKEKIVKMLDLEKLLGRKFSNLSGGQQQKVLIALALTSNPKLLILDEPTVGVDLKVQQSFYEILHKLNSELGVTIIIVTHDVGVIPNYVQSIISINHNICCKSKSEKMEELLEQVYGKKVQMFHHMHK